MALNTSSSTHEANRCVTYKRNHHQTSSFIHALGFRNYGVSSRHDKRNNFIIERNKCKIMWQVNFQMLQNTTYSTIHLHDTNASSHCVLHCRKSPHATSSHEMSNTTCCELYASCTQEDACCTKPNASHHEPSWQKPDTVSSPNRSNIAAAI